jgi:sulfur-oxidizing protein SoxY
VTLLPFAAEAMPEALAAAIREVTGGAEPRAGKVTLDIPPIVENGNTVPTTVSVESPMTAHDYVRAIHVFNEKNPQPHVFSAWLSPGNGRAAVGTRIKLADSQKIVAVAETSTGEFWSASAEVIVTIAACIEDVT